MTDKQIIIDGVDVSGCNFTLERDGKIKCECCHATGFGVICDCESWKTCDYKNYKRKEQELTHFKKENERLLQTIIKDQTEIVQKNIDETNILLIKENTDLQQQLDQLKAENDELKKIIERLDVPKHEVIDMDIALENEKLKQTLAEIRDIATCCIEGDVARIRMKQILQKISEGEDDQSNT